MERITLEEFIEEMRADIPVLRDGHELGLIVNDREDIPELFESTLQQLAQETASITLSGDDLFDPVGLKRAIDSVNGGDAVVVIKADYPLAPKHYHALRTLVSDHALERWINGGTEREMVHFKKRSRFVLVLSRDALEVTTKRFPPFWEMIGSTFSCDGARKEVV